MPEHKKTTAVSRIAIKRLVRRGVANFERQHPGYVVAATARRVAERHASANYIEIAAALQTGELSRREFLDGLGNVLKRAATPKQVQANFAYKMGRAVAGGSGTGFRAATRGRRRLGIVTESALRLAMKGTCKTFPWC